MFLSLLRMTFSVTPNWAQAAELLARNAPSPLTTIEGEGPRVRADAVTPSSMPAFSEVSPANDR
jgi:hypothetical protein